MSRRALIDVSDITMIADCVTHGLGVALLSPHFAETAGDAVRVVLLADARLSWTLKRGRLGDAPADAGAARFPRPVPIPHTTSDVIVSSEQAYAVA
ncbi:hypothetical protein ACFY9A_19290 [Streptomyces rubradiris]|uniref:hypothetical protein n=1 Tax=Streptomyces rubradiris TaxID=285531 RepID=UPI0036E61886